MKTICAYCLKTIIDGSDGRISHGICSDCEKLVVAAELLKESRTLAEMPPKSSPAKLRYQRAAVMSWVKYGLEIGLDVVPRKEVSK